MRHVAILALVLAVLVPGTLAAQARGQQEKQEIGPILRERGQPAPAQPAEDPGPPDYSQSADFTRNRLQQLLWQLPPNVRGVLQYDPSLLEQPDYLNPYPALQAFLKQHPEIARNPTYFFGEPDNRRGPNPTEALAAILAGTGLFIFFMTLLITVGSMAQQVVAYRRWVRQTRMQIDVHTKILDRMQSNEDLLAYVQTPAGRTFLEFAPAGPAPETRVSSAPFGRILWSVQAGVVLAALGIGLRYAQGSVPEEIIPAFTVLGIIVMSLGLGAVISAIVAYVLSSRLGLLPSRKQETNA
jgi:hypothetical protein